jgi:hypothetical protein
MKAATVGMMFAVAIGVAGPRLATAQSTLERLEEGIRAQAGAGVEAVPPGTPAAPPALVPGRKAPGGERPYLGAVVDEQNDRGKGVRVLVVRPGGPADRGGLRAQDLIVGAAGARVRQLSDLTAVINASSPGGKVALEVLRGTRPQRLEVTLGAQIPAVAAEAPAEAIPPPAAERGSGAATGPSLSMPGVPPPPPAAPPVAPPQVPTPPSEIGGPPMSDSARIEQLQRRVDTLERRVQELERALAEANKK